MSQLRQLSRGVRHAVLPPSIFPQPLCIVQLSVGSVRSKNAKNIVLKNLLDACFGAIFFYLIGYGFAGVASDSPGGKFIGWGPFALEGEPTSGWGGWFFQFAVRHPHRLTTEKVANGANPHSPLTPSAKDLETPASIRMA